MLSTPRVRIGASMAACCAVLACVSTTARAQFVGNDIVSGMLCDAVDSLNPFCYVHELAPVQQPGRVIWDGSFSSGDSAWDGPGGRWVGNTCRVDWSVLNRSVQAIEGDGKLVLLGGVDSISAQVFGQTFSDAAGEPVFVHGPGAIRVSFTARMINVNECGQLCWINVLFGQRLPDGSHVPADNNALPGAGENEYWYIENPADGDGTLACSIDIPIDQLGCHVDVSDWLPRLRFGVDWHNQADGFQLHLDDIQVQLVETASASPVNLVHSSKADRCSQSFCPDYRTWTLITGSHWNGGGADNTEPLALPWSSCQADLNGDGLVNVSDLLLVIGNWNSTTGIGDINCDGVADIEDLVMVLGGWGTACP